MNKFKTLLFLAVFGGIGLWGCDDSSSASSNGPDESATVDSSSSICKDCDDGDGSSSSKKVESSDNQSRDSSSDEKSNSSSSKKGNATNSSSSVKNDSNSSANILDGDCRDGDTRTNLVSNAVMFYYHCESGEWIRDSLVSLIDTSENVISRPKVNLDSLFNPDVEYGEYKDIRDGHTYKTVTFVANDKKKYEMFAENLNYGTFVKHDEDADVDVRKYCYDDDEWYCEHLGGLYTYSEALQVPRACDTVAYGEEGCPDESFSGGQGICPIGWKIANNDKFEDCFNAVGRGYVKSIMSKSGWMYSKDNTNSTGLSVYATGIYSAIRNRFENFHKCASFWDPTKRDGESGDKYFDKLFGRPTNGEASLCAFDKSSPTFNYEASAKADALAIRCVREIVE